MENYDKWKFGIFDYEEEADNEYIYREDLPDLDECKRALEDIVELLYNKDMLDVATLDDRLHFLSTEFGIKIPDDQPHVVQAPTREQHLYQWWAGYTRAHAELLLKATR